MMESFKFGEESITLAHLFALSQCMTNHNYHYRNTLTQLFSFQMSITYHQLGTAFDLDATEWDGTVHSIVSAYRHVSTINTEWQCTYEHCREADKSRLEFLAQQYARIPQLSARLNQMAKPNDRIVMKIKKFKFS